MWEFGDRYRGWGGRQRLGMFIFSEGWFRVGVWGQTYHIRDVNIGGGPCGGGPCGGGGYRGDGGFGESYGGCLYHKELGCFETDIGYVNIVGGLGA